MKKYILVLIIMYFVAGCEMQNNWKDDLSRDQDKMHQSGWTYVETLGEPGQSNFTTGVESTTARTVGADWAVGGVQQHKTYKQEDYLYAIHIFMKSNGDSFCLVFRRDKK